MKMLDSLIGFAIGMVWVFAVIYGSGHVITKRR
jgi:hypothetical protein